MNKVVERDLARIYGDLSDLERARLKDSTILFTGGAGSLGFYYIQFLVRYQMELGVKKIICLDNFQNGTPKWISELVSANKLDFYKFDIVQDDLLMIPGAEDADYVCHMASIASPIFYRKYPIETLDADIGGLRRLLEFYKNKPIKGLAFYSSSEIYGDPPADQIPTPETYWGNVDCQGPRACYDESKRLGETLCYLFNRQYQMPTVVIRPFNTYGPGMKLNDARVPADFANDIRNHRDITILSDGKPTRTFCYISDAITGYLKCLLHAQDGFETYNIGMDRPEITVLQLAEIYAEAGKELFGYAGQVRYDVSDDKDYLTNNPNRRCPDIRKAERLLDYHPSVTVDQGVRYFMEYIKESAEDELVW